MARENFHQEISQLRLQVEVTAARVAMALVRMHGVLRTGDLSLADEAVAADDQVDAMVVSLTERVYDLICRESPMASDLRYLVSVLRILEELERIADLSLRVVKQAPEQPMLARHPAVFATLDDMAGVAADLFGEALDAWVAEDPSLAQGVVARSSAMDADYRRLLDQVLALDGADAVAVAVTAVLVGRALERIADHTVIMGERLQYLLTGDPAYLASEVR